MIIIHVNQIQFEEMQQYGAVDLEHGDLPHVCAILSLASMDTGGIDNQWLEELPPADAPTMLCCLQSAFRHAK